MTVHVFDQIQQLLSSKWSSWRWLCCWWTPPFVSTIRYWHMSVVQRTEMKHSVCVYWAAERTDAGSHICVLSCLSRPAGGRSQADRRTLSWIIITWVFLQLKEGRLKRKELREQSRTSKELIKHPDGFLSWHTTHHQLSQGFDILILMFPLNNKELLYFIIYHIFITLNEKTNSVLASSCLTSCLWLSAPSPLIPTEGINL